MTALFVVGCYRGLRARGYFLAVALHAFANIGPFTALIGAWTPEGASLWSGGALLLMAFFFERMRGSDRPEVQRHELLLVRSTRGALPGSRGGQWLEADQKATDV